MTFENTSDDRLLAFHHNIREQVLADNALNSEHRLLGEAAKQYASALEAEMRWRGLRYTPIVWL